MFESFLRVYKEFQKSRRLTFVKSTQYENMQSFFLAKTKSSYHLILKHTWSQTFNSLEKKFFSEKANSKLAICEKIAISKPCLLHLFFQKTIGYHLFATLARSKQKPQLENWALSLVAQNPWEKRDRASEVSSFGYMYIHISLPPNQGSLRVENLLIYVPIQGRTPYMFFIHNRHPLKMRYIAISVLNTCGHVLVYNIHIYIYIRVLTSTCQIFHTLWVLQSRRWIFWNSFWNSVCVLSEKILNLDNLFISCP